MAAAAPARARPRRAATAPAPSPGPRPRPQRSPAGRPRPVARPRIAGGVLWIVVLAVLLAGIVAVNVAALRLNLESQELEQRRQDLQAENATTASKLSSLGAASRVEMTARGRLGLVDAVGASYVKARRPKR